MTRFVKAISLTARRACSMAAVATLATAAVWGLLPVGTQPALAAVGPCRSDPVVLLSSLKALDISATIQDSSSDLRSVDYTIHAPVGTHVLLYVPTDGLVGQVEHFTFVADQPAGHYRVSVDAITGSQVPVTMTMLGVLAPTATATGLSNSNVSVYW